MTYTTHTQQAISTYSCDEQTLAQAELNYLLETQAEAVAPTQDPLTNRDRRIYHWRDYRSPTRISSHYLDRRWNHSMGAVSRWRTATLR